MTFTRYMKDKMGAVILFFLTQLFMSFLCFAFYMNKAGWVSILFIDTVCFVSYEIYDYRKRMKFFSDFESKLEKLEKKHLISEMIEKPEFVEGALLYEYSYEIGRDMRKELKILHNEYQDFKEYIEMWIHEIKVSISGLSLASYSTNESCDAYLNKLCDLENTIENLDKISKRFDSKDLQNEIKSLKVFIDTVENGFMEIKTQMSKQKNPVKRLNFYVEQILYYSRSEKASKDYLMKKHPLEEMVNTVVIANKELLIAQKIKIEKKNLDIEVITDAKWFEFILGQIVNNAIKYTKEKDNKIEFIATKNKDKALLEIVDYGIGINESDVSRVFEKSFTGGNGRIESYDIAKKHARVSSSTGMGLYICKKLCDKLGHTITLESKKGEYTKVLIEIGTDNYYSDVLE